jgi:acyl carrier protein
LIIGELERERLIQAAVGWIRENTSGAWLKDAVITASTPLLRDGILDSLGLVDLAVFLEKTAGNQINLPELDEEDLRPWTASVAPCWGPARARGQEDRRDSRNPRHRQHREPMEGNP